jgi:hypothetical protein
MSDAVEKFFLLHYSGDLKVPVIKPHLSTKPLAKKLSRAKTIFIFIIVIIEARRSP